MVAEVDRECVALENSGSKRAAVTIGLGCLAVSWLVYFYWSALVGSSGSSAQSSPEELRQILDAGPNQSSGAALPPADRLARARAASKLGAMRDEDSMPSLLRAMEDSDPLIRGRAGAAVQKIMKADYYFRAEDPPHRRAETLAEIRRVWEGYLQHKRASGGGGG